MNVTEENELLYRAFRGNSSAMQAARIIIDASQVLDDLWDQDKPVTKEQVTSMVLSLVVDLQRNAFYQQHQVAMVQIIERAIMRWVEANDLEADKKIEGLKISYILRSSVTDAVIEMIYLATSNRDHGRRAAKEIRLLIYGENESFDEYVKEMTMEAE